MFAANNTHHTGERFQENPNDLVSVVRTRNAKRGILTQSRQEHRGVRKTTEDTNFTNLHEWFTGENGGQFRWTDWPVDALILSRAQSEWKTKWRIIQDKASAFFGRI